MRDVNALELLHNVELFDALLGKVIMAPEKFQIVLVLNEYGDFLSDMACGLAGSSGKCQPMRSPCRPPLFLAPRTRSAASLPPAEDGSSLARSHTAEATTAMAATPARATRVVREGRLNPRASRAR